MPIYEYRCGSCGHQQEFLQKVGDAPITVCTECGKPTFSKMVTAAGFQLKGSGWYATDFKNSGSKPAAKEAAKEAAKPDAKDSAAASAPSEAKSDTSSSAKADAPAASSDTKSEAKSETKSAGDKPASTGTTSGGS
jgi:putative FmdB family regulatory protein